VNLKKALGLGSHDGRTVVPVSVWLPVLVVFSALAALLLLTLHGESAVTQLVVLVGTTGLVIPVGTALTLWRNRRR
jgi:hypothetical protein